MPRAALRPKLHDRRAVGEFPEDDPAEGRRAQALEAPGEADEHPARIRVTRHPGTVRQPQLNHAAEFLHPVGHGGAGAPRDDAHQRVAGPVAVAAGRLVADVERETGGREPGRQPLLERLGQAVRVEVRHRRPLRQQPHARRQRALPHGHPRPMAHAVTFEHQGPEAVRGVLGRDPGEHAVRRRVGAAQAVGVDADPPGRPAVDRRRALEPEALREAVRPPGEAVGVPGGVGVVDREEAVELEEGLAAEVVLGLVGRRVVGGGGLDGGVGGFGLGHTARLLVGARSTELTWGRASASSGRRTHAAVPHEGLDAATHLA